MKLSSLFLALHAFVVLPSLARADNSTYNNPILSGWHSDPSCTQVNGTFFCVTSTFISFPGLPIYASKDLINWKHVSHVWNRDSQLPGITQRTNGISSILDVGQSVGMYAATIRYHDGYFYVACAYIGLSDGDFSDFIQGLVFNTTDPFDDSAWSDPVTFNAGFSIDPDLFWDDDGKLYVAMSGITLKELNVETGEIIQSVSIWNGTGDVDPEGPHIYKKDGLYYLLIAEGGTGLSHSITIARARNITGPYESYENNPILTNRNTTEYFQTVGHGDLFQDVDGNWWGVCLATRSGPDFEVYPMGRETVLFPVSWEEGEWPVLQPVRGQMSGWALPATALEIPGEGPFNQDPDEYDFEEGTAIPRNLGFYRVPQETAFTVTSKGLQIVPSRSNLTGDASSNETSGELGLSFIGRIQTDTLFTFSVDLTFNPTVAGQEAGVTVFLTPYNHIDLGLVLLSPEVSSSQATSNRSLETSPLALRFRAEGFDAPSPKTIPIPSSWRNSTIQLQIQATNDTHYNLIAMPAANPNAEVVVTTASAKLVSGDTGPFTGSLVGVYATCNGAGEGLDCPDGGKVYVNQWRYKGIAQYISATESVPEI